ncbi:uncharacterized protein DUF4160 [Spirosoma oryzae]|uniref:Uncharacterized protein DUF4160 n=1 Tax=Spirosoma oryzae TaxID=1469603 RepID=A0A2T0TIP2_9BACT|nr:DUF4160 domain-containing protein [Spirosoma oryzae]PRY45499.1 uncharacterized protein DUF4160 [Spirosoma oryzae]
MPQISRFFGIIIAMYYDDHNPPHFHAKYGNEECLIAIRDLTLLEGRLPSRALGMVIEWAATHQTELAANWELAKNLQPLHSIEPLL